MLPKQICPHKFLWIIFSFKECLLTILSLSRTFEAFSIFFFFWYIYFEGSFSKRCNFLNGYLDIILNGSQDTHNLPRSFVKHNEIYGRPLLRWKNFNYMLCLHLRLIIIWKRVTFPINSSAYSKASAYSRLFKFFSCEYLKARIWEK